MEPSETKFTLGNIPGEGWAVVVMSSLSECCQDPDLQGVPEVLHERPAVHLLDLDDPEPQCARHLLPQPRRGPGQTLPARLQRCQRTKVLPRGLWSCLLSSGLEYILYYQLSYLLSFYPSTLATQSVL